MERGTQKVNNVVFCQISFVILKKKQPNPRRFLRIRLPTGTHFCSIAPIETTTLREGKYS